jgi:hypothetical protein
MLFFDFDYILVSPTSSSLDPLIQILPPPGEDIPHNDVCQVRVTACVADILMKCGEILAINFC